MTCLRDTRKTDREEILRPEARLSEGTQDTRDEDNAASSRYSWLIAGDNPIGKEFTTVQDVHQFLLQHRYDRAVCRYRIEITKVEVSLRGCSPRGSLAV